MGVWGAETGFLFRQGSRSDAHRTPENRGGGRLGRPGKKFGHEIGGVGRKVRIGTDLPRDGQNLFGQALKNKTILQKIPGDRMGQTRLPEAYVGVKIRS